jgi:hypothetical protein
MQQHAFHRPAAIGAVLAVSLALAGCAGAKATPIVIHVTPSPAPSVAATPTATAVATDTATASAAATDTATASAAATDTPASSPSPSPTPVPAPAGTTCSRTPANNQWFVDQAPHLPWSVYCAVLPSGWGVLSGSSEYSSGGYLQMTYKGPGGATLALYEGNICHFMTTGCASAGTDLGTATFGDRSGHLYSITPSTYLFWGDAGTNVVYRADSSGLSEATMRSYLAALLKV